MINTSKIILTFVLFVILLASCDKEVVPPTTDEDDILGFNLLEDLSGHWVGTNETVYGSFDWFAFDFRPISAAHVHSIYEGGTNENIITSIFIADFEGKKQIMGRNGGWLGSQYRATYFVLDRAAHNNNSKYYRLVDAVGKEKRAYMEFRFENDSIYFDAYKDDSGSLDDPIHHMGFKGTNYNPSFAAPATDLFDYPQAVSEVNLENRFVNLLDDDSALFLEESDDPFPKSQHGHLSDLTININRDNSISETPLFLYVSKAPIVDNNGIVDFSNLDTKLIRTIEIQANEVFYETTYLHPDNYYITVFKDNDSNAYPSTGDLSSFSKTINVLPESNLMMDIDVNQQIQ